MPIPESQLRTWIRGGGVQPSHRSHKAIRAAINASRALRSRALDIFLQGSYRNGTNIRGDSDVDIVVRFHYRTGRSQLSGTRLMESPDYSWDQFRDEVLAALITWFGRPAVDDHEKCIKVLPSNSGRAPADVVPALTYRLSASRPTNLDGIAFLTRTDRRLVINYPKQHTRNAAEKNARTGEKFKPTVRLFKNITGQLIDRGWIGEDEAPSYYVESLLWNVPNREFRGTSWQARLRSVHDYLAVAELTSFLRLDGLRSLFGSGQDAWLEGRARNWLRRITELWEVW